jgi:hypothetical protein
MITSITLTAVAAGNVREATAAQGRANRGIVEAVNDFSGCGYSNLSGSITSGSYFASRIQLNTGIISDVFYDNSVWTTDFMDPDGTGYGIADQDHVYFDSKYRAISFFQGHGSCGNNGDTWQLCTTSGECLYPPVGTTAPSFCRRMPYDNYGYCSYTKNLKAIVVGNCTDGPPRAGKVWYGTGSNNVRWGESNHATWGGTGTNGGTNVAIIAASCAEMSNRTHEIDGIFAGVHALLTTFVHFGDTADNPYRGLAFGNTSATLTSSVADSWRASINSLPGGNSCGNAAGTMVNGGYMGVNGCGGYKATATGTSLANALSRLDEDWTAITHNISDSPSFLYRGWRYTCNYDCNTYPFAFP